MILSVRMGKEQRPDPFGHPILSLHFDFWPFLHPLSPFAILLFTDLVSMKTETVKLDSYWNHTLFGRQVRLCLTWVTQSRACNSV